MRCKCYLPLLVVILMLLSACGTSQVSQPLGTRAPSPTPSATLLPSFIATSQSAEANARSTSAAVQSMLDGLKPTQTVLSMLATQADATQTAVAEQTQIARNEHGTTTAQFYAAQTIETSQTQAAYEASVQATQTQVMLNELIRKDTEAQNVLWFTTWAWRIGAVLIFVLAFVAASLVVSGVWKHRQWILTRLGVIRWGPDGKPFWTFASSDGGIVVVDPTRSLGPGVVITPRGQLTVAGMSENPELQDRVTARAQAADLLLAAGPAYTAIDHRQSVRHAALLANPTRPASGTVAYKILPSAQELPPSLLAPANETLEILDAEWNSDDEE